MFQGISKPGQINEDSQTPDTCVGRSPGEGSDNPLQYSCLGHPMDKGAKQATVHGVTKEVDMIW